MAKHNHKVEVSVDLIQQSYPILIGDNTLNADNILPFITGKQVLIVTNETIAKLYLKQLGCLEKSYNCQYFVLPDGEQYKNYESWYSIHDFLIRQNFHRDCTIIALGGGVVGDLTGFVAATFQRGVNLIQIPTTLLAQVDSSVGGKTAINHPLGKNLIGSFYHPSAVIIDLNTLTTLPPREFRAGLAEVIKYGFLDGEAFLQTIEQFLQEKNHLNTSFLTDIIGRCCRIKADYVNRDEKEKGVRALLNLGHTFAHAIETYTQYEQLLHGEAVSIGIYCAALLSHLCGYTDRYLVERVDRLFELANLPRRINKKWPPKALLELMKQDKKIKNCKMRMILIKEVGDCFVDETISDDTLMQVLLLATEGKDE